MPDGVSRRTGILLNCLLLAGLLYLFLAGLHLMGLAFKLFGREFAQRLIETTSDPLVGLFIGILATSLVQSSSTTTSMTVGLVAAEALTIEGAIPIVMGANIGTTVTSTLVSLAHVTRPEEFRRAFAGATVHDFFNWSVVVVLLPVEIQTGSLARASGFLERLLEGAGGIKLFNPLKASVLPFAEWLSGLTGDSGTLTLILGLLLLFMALRCLVDLLKRLLSARAEALLNRTLFRSAPAAIASGVAMTVMVQSSSITTSVMVPLMGAGVVTLQRAFPFFLGANIGTTITAMLASLATGVPAAVSVAFAHLLFNLTGTALVYAVPPWRKLLIALAAWMGDLAARNRLLAFCYVLLAFLVLPLLLVLSTGELF